MTCKPHDSQSLIQVFFSCIDTCKWMQCYSRFHIIGKEWCSQITHKCHYWHFFLQRGIVERPRDRQWVWKPEHNTDSAILSFVFWELFIVLHLQSCPMEQQRPRRRLSTYFENIKLRLTLLSYLVEISLLHLGNKSQFYARYTEPNINLLSSDADGWVIIWKMRTRRPLLKQKAHENSCLKVTIQALTQEKYTLIRWE